MNLCADCANACGGCSWSALDPITNKPMFKPVEGWDAEYVERDYHMIDGGSYDIRSCPQFVPDHPRTGIVPPKATVDTEVAIRVLAEQAEKAKKEINKRRAEKAIEIELERYNKGLCVRCGKNKRRDGKRECDACAKRRREWYERKKAGVCK